MRTQNSTTANARAKWLRRRFVSAYVRSPRHMVPTVAVLLAIIVLLLPSAYVLKMPGPTQDVLGEVESTKVIDIAGTSTHKDSGKLLLVTVSAAGVPGYEINNLQALWAWLDPETDLTPRETSVTPGQTADEYQEQVDEQMDESQDTATTAAVKYLNAHADTLGVNTKDVNDAKITLHVDDIGGPSAGMMYALGIIDEFTATEETGGQIIAGTGTIDDDGNVGAIGGIDMKMQGAKRDGATWFLAPEANCSDVKGHVPDGLRDVKVATLDQAYQAIVAIGKGQADSLPSCSA